MPTMTKTTIVTWRPDQVLLMNDEIARPSQDRAVLELQRLIAADKTTGSNVCRQLIDGSLESRREWVDQESAQAWLDFLLSTVKELYGPDKTFQSGVIEDIV